MRIEGGLVALAFAALFVGVLAVILRPAAVGFVGVCLALVVAVGLLRSARLRYTSSAAAVEQQHAGTPEPEPAPTLVEPQAPRIPATLEPDVMLRALMDALMRDHQPVAAHLWLDDPASATLRLVAAVGPMSPSPRPVASDDPHLGAATAEGKAVLSPLARLQTAGVERVVWRFAIPLSPGQARGVIGVDVACDHDPDAAALAAVCAPFLGPISGALALHVARVETEMATALIEMARDLSRILDPDEVLATALDRAMLLSEAATGSVMLLDPGSGKLVIVKAQGLPAEVVRDTALSEGEGIAGWVLATGQPLLIEDLPTRPRTVRRHGVRSAVSVPISDDDHVLGVINVGSKAFPARFTESHLKALETLGKQTAVALRNARAVMSSRELYFDTLQALAVALETKDPYSRGGTERVLEHATALGEAFGLDDEQREALRVAALLHDIGMSAAGDTIGASQRPLSTVERGLLKLHPQIAAEILQEMPALKEVAPIVYHHHEWYDGQGYLGGLAGQSIPLGARILAVVDAFVAMTSERPYRCAMSVTQAVAELEDKAGTQFDPSVVEVFADLLGSGRHRVPDPHRPA
ncbi:MAG: HD domain-containing phosphohydrolase [Coriobacteriia bacterium]